MEPRGAALPWKHCLHLCLLLVQLSLPEVSASCRILRCNSDFVEATLDLGASGNNNNNAALTVNAAYCGALRSYATCTRRTARACRGDLAYHSAVQGIEDLLIQHRCPRAGPTAPPPPPRAPPRHQETAFGDACLYESSLLAREGRAPDYLHCAVFGDPHVRTFSSEFMTCGVRGAWPLVDNDFLFIQATSAPTRGETHATALTKISIIFKSSLQCGEQQLYQAELDNVPAAFADGSVSSGERRGRHSLTVRTQTPGRHAEIRAAHIGTLLVVRQTGHSLGLSLRSPRGVVEAFGPDQDLQLCVWGCPASQRLDTRRPTPHAVHAGDPVAAAAGARAACAALLPVRDVYFQACVFDLIATGDLNASAAAVSARQDAKNVMAGALTVHLLPGNNAAGQPLAAPPLLLMLVLLGMLGTLTTEMVNW